MVAKATSDIPLPKSVSAPHIAQAVMKPYRELTLAAMLLGIVQGVVLNLAFVYAALKLGFSIGGPPSLQLWAMLFYVGS